MMLISKEILVLGMSLCQSQGIIQESQDVTAGKEPEVGDLEYPLYFTGEPREETQLV